MSVVAPDHRVLFVKAKIYEVFNHTAKKMYFFFGCYNDWNIIVELMEIIESQPNRKYPHLVKSVGKSPRQYPIGQTKDTIGNYYLNDHDSDEPWSHEIYSENKYTSKVNYSPTKDLGDLPF